MGGNSNNNKNENEMEAKRGPKAERWYDLTLGSSFTHHHPHSSNFHTLRYEFKPASCDKNQPGLLHKNKDNRVTVEFNNIQPGKHKAKFEGSSEDYKEHDAVLFFDGERFRLERLHRSVKQLRHVRDPGESASVATSFGPVADSGSPPLAKAPKYQSMNRNIPPPMPVEIERIEVGDFKSSDAKYRSEKVHSSSSQPKPSAVSPEPKEDDLDEQLDMVNEDVDILNDDDENDVGGSDVGKTASGNDIFTGIDINIPHQNETDEEIADVDISDDENKGPNAAEALRAQLNPVDGGRNKPTSSSSASSGSSSGSSRSGSGTRSSSSASESSDADSITSI